MSRLPKSHRPTVAVIGAGFSGLMTALSLLEQPHGPRVRLIERRQAFGRGAAYSTTFKDHLLNVRASNMSAFPDQPDHFVNWLAREGEVTGAAAFVRRSRYGAYLQAMLAKAAEKSEAGRLLLEADGVVGLTPRDCRWRLTYDMGRALDVDAVVLAVGNFPPHQPAGITDQAAASPAYVPDPWGADFGSAPQEGQAVLIGTGLTMVDVALRLAAERPDLKLLAISRRGLLPHRHLEGGPAPLSWDPGRRPSVRRLIRQMRALSRSADWRSVIDGVRPHVQGIWREWTDEERDRFLRHARPWWDIHRHRLAPAVAAQIDDLIRSGVLTVRAGRIGRIVEDGDDLRVDWRPKGVQTLQTACARLVVNCTGPMGQPARSPDPLIADLARQALIRPDRQNLGLDVDAFGRVIAADGAPSSSLYSIGPVTRGAFWEITSVPDIRVQAVTLARQISGQLADQGAEPWPSRPAAASEIDLRLGTHDRPSALEARL
jgi:uncharacterized NAD(P)/FAD-binding protein YdhS